MVEPRPITVDVDSDVALNCKWSGNPPLTLTWTKKGSNMVQKQHSQPLPAKPKNLLFTAMSCFTKMSDIKI